MRFLSSVCQPGHNSKQEKGQGQLWAPGKEVLIRLGTRRGHKEEGGRSSFQYMVFLVPLTWAALLENIYFSFLIFSSVSRPLVEDAIIPSTWITE